MNHRRRLPLALLLVAFATGNNLAQAEVKLPAIFSNHMVLQSGRELPVWGWADAGEKISVAIAGQSGSTTAGADGKWQLKLAPLAAGGPHTMAIEGKNRVTIDDVLVGEVWLGSGQSNMAMAVRSAQNYEAEAAAATHPQIRMFTERSAASAKPEPIGQGEWVVCQPETVGGFSATLYFFGREIHQARGVPVGLINSSVGGTPIESWIDAGVQRNCSDLKGFFTDVAKANAAVDIAAAAAKYERDLARWTAMAREARAARKPVPRRPLNPRDVRARKGDVGGLFNGKIVPLVPYAIRGAIWYQGEANSNPPKPPYYLVQLPLLVNDWRARWGYDFPFAWVQLPNFRREGEGWMLVREAMLESLKVPHTGMAITVDVGDPANIHPTNKQEVGRRLALWARGDVYGEEVATSGPLPAGHEMSGNKVVCHFTHADGGLVAKGGKLEGFTIAGADRQWLPAEAKIEGNSVVVWHAAVQQPVAVRYAWADNPTASLYNKAGLPASPFRTDRFDTPQ